MGTRTTGVESSSPEELEQEIARIREGIDPLARELDRRRHRVMNIRSQVKRKAPKVMKLVGMALGVLTAVKAVRRRMAHRHATA